ncbi:MAG: hypothetical protein H6833_06470 [Planctomycetes bacterium]|nr:hypothetical protein [Planctomycetota bacterium]
MSGLSPSVPRDHCVAPIAMLTLLLALAMLGGRIRAQLPTIDLKTEGVIGVFAGNTYQNSLNNQKITNTLSLVDTFVRGSQDVAHTKTFATRTQDGCRIIVDSMSLGRGASTGTAQTSQSIPGLQAYDFGVSSKVRQFVDIFIQYRGSTSGSARAAASVTTVVGNHTLIPDGANHSEWIRGLPLSALSSSVRIVVDAQCSGSSIGSVAWEITVDMLPVTRCALAHGQSSCNGVGSLSGRVLGVDAFNAVHVDMETTTSLASPTFATLLVAPTGNVVSNVPGFVDSSCILLANAPIALESRAVANGHATFRIIVPASLIGQIWLQSLLTRQTGSVTLFATTNTMHLTCQ